jgi:hypothetical protein
MKAIRSLSGGLAAFLILASSFVRADAASYPSQGYDDARRSAYSYVRVVTGDVTVQSNYNGRVTAARNMPISSGDEISVSDAGRAEIALADGNLLEIGGGTEARFVSLASQQGDEDSVSAIRMSTGSVILASLGSSSRDLPRIDTDDLSIYLNAGARVRVNADSRRGTAVIVRAGNAEVRTPQGSYTVHAGEYLLARAEEEPQIERGTFSRDRFDIWAADRLETATDPHGVAARYVDADYSSDVVPMDASGDWSYSPEYGTDVWSPRVDPGWTPYSNGLWYYTPAGLTWWSYDPWGWFPFHYGSWCFSTVWNHWCWLPASVYSPAWVYWGFSSGFVGWCPIGVYSSWSPWFGTYFPRGGLASRGSVAIAIQGTFPVRSVDFRGWSFVGARNFAASTNRMDVISGARIAERLGLNQISVSSRPIVLSPRAGNVHEAIQSFVREAPLSVGRTASNDSGRFAPILAHQKTLPADTVAAVAQHSVVARDGRLSGPGIADVAPRGALVDRSRSLSDTGSRVPVLPEGRSVARPDVSRSAADWRSRANDSRSIESLRQDDRSAGARMEQAPTSDWRSRSRIEADSSSSFRSDENARRDAWRSREDMPPARRVIEGAVPGRRSADHGSDEIPRGSWRDSSQPSASRQFTSDSRQAPRTELSQPRESHAGPPPPPPHVERAPVQSAPAVHSEPHHASPPPNRSRPDK